ncbi:DUF721 domain-containing protein [Glacieibacterium frigidum]|uniref:DUF721 domain-containing protein n=1 Tax=Glacieibacterium frigidum TaxID=2593303 RepID=A0A552UIT7_9SPHN|nr:DUF721 domain-containing protein [Glacieibacterium frigidum]TRW18132.1 DUF721 domain-containing protein [Glacieibacterium frigidum]
MTETTPEGRSRYSRAVGEALPKVGGAAFRRYGFMHSQIVARWADIVGAEYARHSTPEALKFPIGKKSGGTLSVLVTGAFAPMLRHVEPQVVERANRFFGYAAVARLALRHGDLPVARRRRAAAPAADLAPATQATLKDIADPDLRASLESLAHSLAGTSGLPVIR